MRWRSFRAVAGLSCQIGARIPITSALVTSDIGIPPMRGKAWRLRLPRHSSACSGERQPGRSCFQTCRVASAKVGVDSVRRFSERGSPPSRASFRLAKAFSRASFSETCGKAEMRTARSQPQKLKTFQAFSTPSFQPCS